MSLVRLSDAKPTSRLLLALLAALIATGAVVLERNAGTGVTTWLLWMMLALTTLGVWMIAWLWVAIGTRHER